jgi:hypothetical protein
MVAVTLVFSRRRRVQPSVALLCWLSPVVVVVVETVTVVVVLAVVVLAVSYIRRTPSLQRQARQPSRWGLVAQEVRPLITARAMAPPGLTRFSVVSLRLAVVADMARMLRRVAVVDLVVVDLVVVALHRAPVERARPAKVTLEALVRHRHIMVAVVVAPVAPVRMVASVAAVSDSHSVSLVPASTMPVVVVKVHIVRTPARPLPRAAAVPVVVLPQGTQTGIRALPTLVVVAVVRLALQRVVSVALVVAGS